MIIFCGTKMWGICPTAMIPKQYSQIEGKTFDQLKAELLIVYNLYPEYYDPELGGGNFSSMVDLFADDNFYHEHYVAKQYKKMKGEKNVI